MHKQFELFNKLVLVCGCFDLPHLGHLKFFKAAKAQGDYLIVALIKDEAIAKKKGKDRPVMNWNDRYEFLSGIKYIDEIVPIENFNPAEALRLFNPFIFFKGNDQLHVDESYAKENGIQIVHYTRLKDGYSTTELITKIKSL